MQNTVDVHKQLVDRSLAHLKNLGYDQFFVDHDENYVSPAQVGRHKPDISAYYQKRKLTLVEAKIQADLDNQRTREQFADFYKSGLNLIISIPEMAYNETAEILNELGISPDGKKVIIWRW